MKKVLAGITALLLAVALPNLAVAASGIGKGSTELFAAGALSLLLPEKVDGDENKTSMFLGTAGVGYFVTDMFQVNFSVVDFYVKNEQESDGDKTTTTANSLGLSFSPRWYFYKKGQTVIPYVGLQAGFFRTTAKQEEDGSDTVKNSSNSFSYGGLGGVKFFLSENTSFNVEYNYNRYEVEVGENNDTLKADSHTMLFGISYYF